MNALLAAPVLIPLAACALAALASGRRGVQRVLAVGASAATLGVSGTLLFLLREGRIATTQIGAWPAPFGIALVADLFSVLMLVFGSLAGLAVALYALTRAGENLEQRGYHPLALAMLAGVNGSFLTGDLFNLYVAFEVMLMASFALMALAGGRERMRGTIRYLAINLFGSFLFLVAVGLIYRQTGALNLADIALCVREGRAGPVLPVAGAVLLAAFALKSAVIPLHFWLPASYPAAPPAVVALFAGLLTKVGVYAMIRFHTLVLSGASGAGIEPVLLAVAGVTMIVGVFGAVCQSRTRHILSVHIVSQIGYMIMGLGLMTPLGLAGAIYFILHNIVVKTNLFLVAGVLSRDAGSDALADMGGAARRRPWLAAVFLVSAFSLAGAPPLSGFWGKFALIRAGFEAGAWISATAALVAGAMTLYSMTKIWAQAFWKAAPGDDSSPIKGKPASVGLRFSEVLALAALAVATVVMGLAAGPLLALCLKAAHQLLRFEGYLEAVLEVSS